MEVETASWCSGLTCRPVTAKIVSSNLIGVATFFAQVAQSVEQGTENPRVIGSIPIGGTINADVAHPVERHLAKVEVASSSLVIRSINSLCL